MSPWEKEFLNSKWAGVEFLLAVSLFPPHLSPVNVVYSSWEKTAGLHSLQAGALSRCILLPARKSTGLRGLPSPRDLSQEDCTVCKPGKVIFKWQGQPCVERRPVSLFFYICKLKGEKQSMKFLVPDPGYAVLRALLTRKDIWLKDELFLAAGFRCGVFCRCWVGGYSWGSWVKCFSSRTQRCIFKVNICLILGKFRILRALLSHRGLEIYREW